MSWTASQRCLFSSLNPMRDAGQTVQAQVSMWAGEDESRCWSSSCFQLWDRNLLPETNCSTFCFPQTSSLPLTMTEMISYCAGWVQPWAQLPFFSSPCTEPLPTHRGIQWCFTLVFHSLRALTSGHIPAGGSPPHLCAGASCPWWGWTFGMLQGVFLWVCTVFLSGQQSCRNPPVLSHWMENPFCKDTELCKSCLGSCSSGSAPSLVLGAARSVHHGFLARFCCCGPQQWWLLTGLFLAGSFPVWCLWQPLQPSVKAGISGYCQM